MEKAISLKSAERKRIDMRRTLIPTPTPPSTDLIMPFDAVCGSLANPQEPAQHKEEILARTSCGYEAPTRDAVDELPIGLFWKRVFVVIRTEAGFDVSHRDAFEVGRHRSREHACRIS